MSVLIKGMEMPVMPEKLISGERIPFIEVKIFADGTAVTSKSESPYYTEYSVVEVPPHGRLIDADDLRNKEIIINYDQWDNTFEDGLLFVMTQIDIAPTVIEAEGKE